MEGMPGDECFIVIHADSREAKGSDAVKGLILWSVQTDGFHFVLKANVNQIKEKKVKNV